MLFFRNCALSELPNSMSTDNVVVLPTESREENDAEKPIDSHTDTENLKLPLL